MSRGAGRHRLHQCSPELRDSELRDSELASVEPSMCRHPQCFASVYVPLLRIGPTWLQSCFRCFVRIGQQVNTFTNIRGPGLLGLSGDQDQDLDRTKIKTKTWTMTRISTKTKTSGRLCPPSIAVANAP